MITRRNLFLTALAAPAIIRTPGLLMPVRVFRTDGYGTYEDYLNTVSLASGIPLRYLASINK